MSTATSEKIHCQQERLGASIQTVREVVRQALLEKGPAIAEAQRQMAQYNRI